MLTSLFNIARGTVLLLGVVAFGAFVWVYNEQVETEKARLSIEAKRQADADRETYVYQALVAAGTEGLDFAAIQQDASELDTLRALIDLTAKGAVHLNADGTYVINARIERENPFARNAALADTVIAHVGESPEGYTARELVAWLMESEGLSRTEAEGVLKPLLSPAIRLGPVLAPATDLPSPLPDQKLTVRQ